MKGFDPAASKQLFNSPIAEGLLATGAGGHPAAHGGQLKRLWEMPECIAVGPELGLDQWAGRTRAEGCDLAFPVQVHQAIHLAHIHGQHGLTLVQRVDMPSHTGTTTIGDQVNGFFGGPGEQSLNFVAAGRESNAIRKHAKFATAHGQPVSEALAPGMPHPGFRGCVDQ